MFKKIQKRNGSIVNFDEQKIVNAIFKAGQVTCEFDRDTAYDLASKAITLAKKSVGSKIPTIEDVQDAVEKTLMSSDFHKSAKSYTIYRDQRSKLRDLLNSDKTDLIDVYLQQINWDKNSNTSYSLQGLNNYMSSEISKLYWLSRIYSQEIKEAHLSGDFHIHNLNVISANDAKWDLSDLLKSGFKGDSNRLEASPAKHFRTALGQVLNFFFTLQSETSGAQTFSHVDTYLAPFIRSDNLDYNEVKQALQEFIFNLNVSTRIGLQTPFTNIELDINIDKKLQNEPVITDGKTQKDTYGNYQKEVYMFNRALLEIMMQGDANGSYFNFPTLIYNVTDDFKWGNNELETLWKEAFDKKIPCLLNQSKIFKSSDLAGSIGVVTINVARLGQTSLDEAEFFQKFERLIEMARSSLDVKRKMLESLTSKPLYPYSKFYLREVKELAGYYWQNHKSLINIMGLEEACLNMSIKNHKKFSSKVVDFLNAKTDEFCVETGNIYKFEPQYFKEVSYRFARMDKEKYPSCSVANEAQARNGEEPFYSDFLEVIKLL